MPSAISPKLLLQIFDRIISPSLHFKKRKVLLSNFRGLSTNQYPCFLINILGVLVILERQKKNRKATKNEIGNRNTDLPC